MSRGLFSRSEKETIRPVPISPERRAIALRIKEAIDRKGISQNGLARHFKKVPSAANGWTSGRTQPSLEQLAEICRMTGVSADWLLGVAGARIPEGVDVRKIDAALKESSEALEKLKTAIRAKKKGTGGE